MRRRKFIQHAAATTCALTIPAVARIFANESSQKLAHDIVPLGKTGIRASRLAMGTGTHGFGGRSSQTQKLGLKGLADLLHAAHDQGVNFWDAADQYGTHRHLQEALQRIPREKVVILTKTHATTAQEMQADLDRFRREIGTDYLDIVLLHFMTDPAWPVRKRGAMEALARAREEGIVRAHGVSCHTLGALEAAAHSEWVQIDLARINFAGMQMDAEVTTVVELLQQMHRAGKGVIGMKILGGGPLRYQVDECLRYVLNLDCVDAFTIGQESRQELEDLLQRIPAASGKV